MRRGLSYHILGPGHQYERDSIDCDGLLEPLVEVASPAGGP